MVKYRIDLTGLVAKKKIVLIFGSSGGGKEYFGKGIAHGQNQTILRRSQVYYVLEIKLWFVINILYVCFDPYIAI